MDNNIGTPLINSTSRRDLFTNSPTTSNKFGKISTPDDVTLANLIITPGKLKDLETEIATEAQELGTLKEAITKSEQLSFRISRILAAYENRMASLERIVMPVYRNILNMSQVNDRIESTISLVEHLIRINEQVRKEVVILLPGPMIDNLTLYLDSIRRLEAIQLDLSSSGNCKISLERATGALTDAHSKLQGAFKTWTESSTSFKGEDVYFNSGDNQDNGDIGSDSVASALRTIVDFSMNSPNLFSSLIADWIEIRSNYLAASCETLFAQAQSFKKDPSGYLPGSHPLPNAFAHAQNLLRLEEVFMSKVWPVTAVGPTFLRSAQIVRDLALSTVESITGSMKKALSRREYSDQMYLFNVLGSSLNSFISSDESLANQVLLPSLKFFTTSTSSILIDLIGEIRGTIPRALERPFTIPQNATVYELTSMTVNVLKRTERDASVIESILKGQLTDNWDGSLTSRDRDDSASLPNLRRYFSDVLGSLETAIDTKSKTLRKPMQTLLFQLNNYNYLFRGIGQMEIIADKAVVKRYEQIIEALKRSFHQR